MKLPGTSAAMFSSVSLLLLTIGLPALLAASASAQVSETFQLFDDGKQTLRITNFRSGEVCSDGGQPTHVCAIGLEIHVLGQEMCDWSATTKYPCTRYGYEFDFSGGAPNGTIHCKVTRSIRTVFGPETERVTGENTAEYTEELHGEKGKLFHHGFQTYAPVDERVLVYENHVCTHLNAKIFQVNFVHRFEPE